MLTYIVYSHTEFLDVLLTQTHYLKPYNNKVLLINKSDKDLSDLYSNYKQVIFYDDTLPYASRILSLSDLDLDYILFIHDIDIVITKNDKVINHFVDFMKKNDIDRIDLQVRPSWDFNNWNRIYTTIDDIDIELRKQTNINNYIYNVNPSIWKLDTFLDVMNRFKDKTYRSIETSAQQYCSKFNIYKLYSDQYVNCGHFGCLPFFQFIHITHGGKLLPLTNNNLNDSLIDEYKSMLNKFSLTETRQFSTRSFPWYYHGASKKTQYVD